MNQFLSINIEYEESANFNQKIRLQFFFLRKIYEIVPIYIVNTESVNFTNKNKNAKKFQ